MKKMMPNVALIAALICAIPAPVFAAADIDLLTFDTLPAERPVMPDPAPPVSDAEPLGVTPPETAPTTSFADPKPLPPVDVAPAAPVKKAPKLSPKAPAKAHGTPAMKLPVKAAIKPPAEMAKPPVVQAATPIEVQQDPLKAVAPHPAPAPTITKPPETSPVPQPAPVVPPAALSKPIAAGDRLVIAVAGETDLSGTYQVMPDGTVVLPLIGSVRAQGFTADKFAEILTQTLKDGYLVDPKITITTATGTAP